ncbi:MAG: hypothetical protein LBJ16_01925 [Holosporaceae bacterium]|nr:hypothetical protein [Holosporaceae bacterium]
MIAFGLIFSLGLIVALLSMSFMACLMGLMAIGFVFLVSFMVFGSIWCHHYSIFVLDALLITLVAVIFFHKRR